MFVVMDGEKIEAMREERGLSRQELAKEAGVSAKTVARVERGGQGRSRLVRLGTARGVGRALGVDPKSLRQPKR